MLWQTSIMDSGKHDFLDWIISSTIHLENSANKGPLSGNINYRVSFSMSDMPPTGLISLCLACGALRADENQIKFVNFIFLPTDTLFKTLTFIIGDLCKSPFLPRSILISSSSFWVLRRSLLDDTVWNIKVRLLLWVEHKTPMLILWISKNSYSNVFKTQ